IRGNLRARFCRADLSLERIDGRIDVENDFGRTVWSLDGVDPEKDHRLVTQSGTIEVRLGRDVPGKLPLTLFSACGPVHLADGRERKVLEPVMSHSASGDTAYRAWHGFVSLKHPERDGLALFDRVAAALHGRSRKPGADVINRAGAILVVEPPGGA